MKRILLAALLGIFITVGLGACGGMPPGEEEVGAVASALLASPSQVQMPDTQVNDTSSKLVILTNDKSQIEEIVGYSFNPTWSGAYSYSPAMAMIQPGASITTAVFFTPKTVGQQDTRLYIRHKLGGVVQPDLVIDVKGKGIP